MKQRINSQRNLSTPKKLKRQKRTNNHDNLKKFKKKKCSSRLAIPNFFSNWHFFWNFVQNQKHDRFLNLRPSRKVWFTTELQNVYSFQNIFFVTNLFDWIALFQRKPQSSFTPLGDDNWVPDSKCKFLTLGVSHALHVVFLKLSKIDPRFPKQRLLKQNIKQVKIVKISKKEPKICKKRTKIPKKEPRFQKQNKNC